MLGSTDMNASLLTATGTCLWLGRRMSKTRSVVVEDRQGVRRAESSGRCGSSDRADGKASELVDQRPPLVAQRPMGGERAEGARSSRDAGRMA